MIEYKEILDVCCGSKMFWFDKNHPDVLFCDIREEEHILCDGRKLEIKPDLIMDFRDLKFPDGHFKLVVFDPPHLKNLGDNSWMAKKYGRLGEDWEEDLRKGFNESWRVLEDRGILIFKWSTRDISVSKLLKLFDKTPLFGHKTTHSGQTIWLCFMKKITEVGR